MKRIQTLIRTAVLGLLVGGASLAHASTQTWTFSSVAFDDGTILSGSFSYDAAVDNVLSYSISVQSGSLPAFTYDMTDSGVYTYSSTSPNPIAAGFYGPNELFIANNDGSSSILLDFAAPLTDAGGSVALLTGNASSDITASSYETNGDSSVTRYVTQGSVTTGSVTAVPEPGTGTYALCGLAGLALISIRRRQRG